MYIYTDLYTHAYKCTHIYAYIHMTRGNFNHFSCARTRGLSFIQPFPQCPKCGEVIVKTWNLRFSITSFQDIELWRGGNKIYCDLHDLPVCYQRKNQNASFALCLPNVATLSNIAESLLAVLMSPPPPAACYLQPNRLLHGRAPGKQDRESPVSPKAATAALQQDLHQTWQNKQFPWLVCGWCLISHELTQKRFSSVSPHYPAPKKTNLTALLPSAPSADKLGWSGPTGSKVLKGRDEDINRAWSHKPP